MDAFFSLFVARFCACFLLCRYDRILYFDFDRLDLKVGPLAFGFDLPANETRVGKKRPFFVFLYADDEVCIARGRGGGIAVWKKVDRQYREDEGAYV